MADEPIDKFEELIPESMRARGRITVDALLSPVRDVINRRGFPKEPLSDEQVELLLHHLKDHCHDDWQAYTQHRFLRELATGALPKAA
ncbi:MAG: hypothetical protein ACQET3_12385, partial [Promethearchaeati archaeon]